MCALHPQTRLTEAQASSTRLKGVKETDAGAALAVVQSAEKSLWVSQTRWQQHRLPTAPLFALQFCVQRKQSSGASGIRRVHLEAAAGVLL